MGPLSMFLSLYSRFGDLKIIRNCSRFLPLRLEKNQIYKLSCFWEGLLLYTDRADFNFLVFTVVLETLKQFEMFQCLNVAIEKGRILKIFKPWEVSLLFADRVSFNFSGIAQ